MASLKLTPAIAVAFLLLFARSSPSLELKPRPTEPAYVAAPPGVPADTVAGWVVDANDWLDRGFLGVRHKQAAVTSADLGEPLVILTDVGSIIYPVTLSAPSGPMMDNVRLIPFAEQRIVATGRIVTRAGERGIVIDRIARDPQPRSADKFPVHEAADTRVFGRVTALSCWLGRLDTGAASARCVETHAATGEPLVVVTDSGDMYYPVVRDTSTDPPDFTKLFRYVEQRVVVTGTVVDRGKARGLVIKSVSEFAPDRSSEVLRPEGSR